MAAKRGKEIVWAGGLVPLEGGRWASVWLVEPGVVVGFRAYASKPAPKDVVAHFLETTRDPIQGKPHTPDAIAVSTQEIGTALGKAVPKLIVGIRTFPGLDELARRLDEDERGSNSEQQPAGDETYFGPGITAEQLAAFFRGAARFAKAKPWTVFRGLILLGVSSKSLGVDHGLVTVLGTEGGPGLVFFRDYEAFERNLRSIESSQKMTDQIFLELEHGETVPPAMRQEVLRHQWPLASRDAYPWVRVVEGDQGDMRPGRPEELQLMQAVAAAVGDLCERVPKLRAKIEREIDVSHTCSVPLADGSLADVALSLPPELPESEEDDGLAGFFRSAEVEALGREPRFAELVMRFAMNEDLPPQRFRPADVKRWVFEVIVREVPVEPGAARFILEDIATFLHWLDARGQLNDAKACLDVVDPRHTASLEKSLANPRKHSPIKALILEGMHAGFDMSSEKDIERYLRSRGGPPAPPSNKPKPKRRR